MPSPLSGKRIVVTRPADQAESFCKRLEAAGAHPIRFPTIRLEPVAENAALRRELGRLAEYDHVIFTSVNGVDFSWRLLTDAWPAGVHVAAIGPATAEALRRRGVRPDFVPEEFRAEQIAQGLDQVAGRKILLLRARTARTVLADMLRAREAQVKEVAAYETRMNRPDHRAFASLEQGFDVLTFTSASTVEGFAAIAIQLLSRAVVACIGPITADAAYKCGLPADVIAETYTIDGLIQRLTDFYAHAR